MALLQRVVLLQGQRVDRAHEPQLALELAGPGGGGDALGHRRRLGGHGRVRLGVEVAPAGLDGRLQAQGDLGLVDLGPAGPARGSPRGGAPRRRARAGARRAGSPRPAAPRTGDDGARAARRAPSPRPRAASATRRAEAIERGLPTIEVAPPALRGLPRLDGSGQPLLDLGEAAAEELASLAEPGGAHLEVGSQRTDGAGPLLELGLGRGHRVGPLDGSGLLGLEQRQRGVELGHPGLLAADALGQLVGMAAERLLLGGRVAAVGLDALQALGGGGEAAVVLVEGTGQRGLGLAGLVEQGAGAVEAGLGVDRPRWSPPRRARGLPRGRRRWRRWTGCRRAIPSRRSGCPRG